jgi:murein DD-endopeptidase MepM/ murein hydrolase activator NlpD
MFALKINITLFIVLVYPFFFLHSQIEPLHLVFPTGNQFLIQGQNSDFFQFVDRTFEQQKTTPWEGGQFGFVRNPLRINGQIIHTKFHEGIDIKPLNRDSAGIPQDQVKAILKGTVVHIAKNARQSNYGQYIVIKHNFPYGSFYSLYAHLSSTRVTIDQQVDAGTPIAILGYTGDGIDRRRAHLHLELNLLLSDQFESWHQKHYNTPNHHGIYNGMNLLGLDIQKLFLDHQHNPQLSVIAHIKNTPAYFEFSLSSTQAAKLISRYPWLLDSSTIEPAIDTFLLRCSTWGLPLSLTPSTQSFPPYTITKVKDSPIPHLYNTRGLIMNRGSEILFTQTGFRFIELLIQ